MRFASADILAQAESAALRVPLLRLPRGTVRALFSLAVIAVCVIDVSAGCRNTRQSAVIGYTCTSLAVFACGVAFAWNARCASGLLRMRWSVMAAAALAVSAGYAQCSSEIFGLNAAMLRPFQAASFTAGEVLYLLAIVLFFSGVSRSIVALDVMQALLLAVLRFNLTYTTSTSDRFTTYHLLVSQAFALFLFLIAVIAGLGAASSSEHRFLRLLSWFFGLRFIGFFCSDQISYIWLHYVHCSLWDVPFIAALGGFAIYLLRVERGGDEVSAEQVKVCRPSVAVRSLMPSLLALTNLILALVVQRLSTTGAALSILFTVLAYVARTTLLQSHAFRESALLQSRNEQLEGLATRDHLTGIGNRRSLAGVYTGLQASAGANRLALLLMDIDQFKRANDVKGHLYGDEVLIALARTLQTIGCGVHGSHCARFGGDEFALLLPEVSPERAVLLAEQVRCAFAAHAFEAGERAVSISLGVYLLDAARRLPLEAVIACADAALYRAKTLGRDRVEVYAAHQPDGKDEGVEDSGPRLALQHAG